jgi:UDP-N-acetyl-D-glucosamine/UDP-N-acetyl-D-galactosamine dehydrogenase
MYTKILAKEYKVAVIGLGYVGLPIALEMAKKVSVIGYDIKPERIEQLKQKKDPSKELPPETFNHTDILFTSDYQDIKVAKFFIIAVPTPVDKHQQPDLVPLLNACHTVGKVLKKGDYVVFESTVYPGCTEEDCVPILEKESGLNVIVDFKVGFSPERINPGDKIHTLTSIIKVVSGCDKESLDEIAKTYELVIQAGVYRASSIKVAEAAKIIENTQRDVNIGLMNELSIIFNRLKINTYEVLEAAGTKWNFLKFYPGLVGGHCIGVDPYYLTYKAKQLGYHAQIINSGRFVNDSMGGYVAKQVVKKIIAKDKDLRKVKILVLGITFKENVSDIRNSKVVDLVKELETYHLKVDVVDSFACKHEVMDEYGIKLAEDTGDNYDAIIVAVGHDHYAKLTEADILKMSAADGLLVDIKGIFRNRLSGAIDYWSL